MLQIDHCGKSGAVNVDLDVASGDYFAILDADDQLPEKSISNRLKGGSKIINIGWGIIIEAGKLMHDFFGLYKK